MQITGNGVRNWRLALTMAILLSGCASYHPLPLGPGEAVLSAPVAAVLSADAAKIVRPFLKPVLIDLNVPLDANAIGVIAVLENPDLRALRVHAGVAEAQAFAARLLPDPTFNVSIDQLIAGPDSHANFVGQWVQDINLIRQRKLIATTNAAQLKQTRLDLAWAEWQTAGAARLQAARIVELENQVAINRISSQSATVLLDTSLRAALRGDVSGDPVQANRLSALDTADKLRTSEAALATARGELNRLLGLPPETRLALVSRPESNAAFDPARLFDIARSQRTDLQALRAGYAVQEAAVHKAVLDQFPTLTLGFNGTRDTTPNTLLGTAVNFTLPLWNRNRGGIAVARATREALKADYESRLFQTRSDIAAAVAGIGIAQHSVDALGLQLPLLERYATSAARAAARGDLAAVTATLAAQALRDRQVQLSAARQAVAEQIVALELLTGAPMATWDQTK